MGFPGDLIYIAPLDILCKLRYVFFTTFLISYSLFLIEIEYPVSTSDSSVGEWKVTDIAGPSQLGTRERLHYKKDLYGEL